MAAMTTDEFLSYLDALDDPDFDIDLQHMGAEIERQWEERNLWPTE